MAEALQFMTSQENKDTAPRFGIVGKLWIAVSGIISALWALSHEQPGSREQKDSNPMFARIQDVCNSMGMTGDATKNKLAQIKNLVQSMPEKDAKAALDEVMRTMAVARSPSSVTEFDPPSGVPSISPEIRRTAWELQSLAVNLLKESSGKVHAETAVAVAGGFTGAFLLIQHHGKDVQKLKPGSAIMSDVVNTEGTVLMEFLLKSEAKAGLKADILKEIPEAHQPHVTHEKINAEFVPRALTLCRNHGLGDNEAPIAAALATVFLIEQVKTVLNPAVSNSIALTYLVFCSKTAPAAVA